MPHSNKAIEALGGFQRKTYSHHHPKMMCLTCIDGREAGARDYLPLGQDTIGSAEIAAVIPPPDKAPVNIRNKFSFRQIKGIDTIFLIGHSSCGGAQAVMAYPDVSLAPSDEIRDIVEGIALSGEDLPRLRDCLVMACEGDKELAADMLSRHLAIASLRNISQYKDVGDQIIADKLDAVALYHVLNEDTGLLSSLERYDVAKMRWIDIREEQGHLLPHMCDRPNNCKNCTSCSGTIQLSLAWIPVQVADDEGHISMVTVPLHIKKLLEERRALYQPKTAKAVLSYNVHEKRVAQKRA